MSRPGFICVGGPLDGKLMPQRDRATSFEVVDGPDPSKFGSFDPAKASEPCDLVVKHHWYTLCEHDLHGAAWAYQS